MFRSDTIFEILEISGCKPEIVNLTGVFQDKKTHKTVNQQGSIRDFEKPGQAYLLGLLAKIKCSICSYQLNLWYLLHGNK